MAGDRRLAVAGPLGELLPAGGIRRGSTVALDGPPGAGSTTVAFLLAAATTSVGEWAAVVDPDGTMGARAAAEMGVALERCAIVRHVPPDRWATVVGALLDGVSLVAAAVPPALRPGDARRLTARARERATVLVALGPWPVEAALRLHAVGRDWSALATGGGLLTPNVVDVRVEGKVCAPTPVRDEPERQRSRPDERRGGPNGRRDGSRGRRSASDQYRPERGATE